MLKHISLRRVFADTSGLLPDLHPLLRRIYLARDILSDDDLQKGLDGLLPLTGLAGIDPALDKLEQALQAKPLAFFANASRTSGTCASIFLHSR